MPYKYSGRFAVYSSVLTLLNIVRFIRFIKPFNSLVYSGGIIWLIPDLFKPILKILAIYSLPLSVKNSEIFLLFPLLFGRFSTLFLKLLKAV